MYEFFVGILLPIIVLIIIITFLSTISKMILDLLKTTSVLLKIVLFLVLFHFVGRYIYLLLLEVVGNTMPSFMEFLYTPTHYVIDYFKNL